MSNFAADMKVNDKKLWIPIGIGATFILGAFIICFYKQSISDNIADWASFGAYVGGCFGFISVVIMYMVFREQSRMSYKSQFEAVFFDMLRTLREIKTTDVDDLFTTLSIKISNHFKVEYGCEEIPKEDLQGVIRYYISYQDKYPTINHYFRYLYHIIKYVEEDKILDSLEKEKYVSLIQAQTSNQELIMTFFNVIGYNNTEYLKWLDDYGFFENMQTDSVFLSYIIKTFFPKTKNKYIVRPTGNIEDAFTEWYDELCVNLDDEQCIETINRLKKRNNQQ